MKISDRKGNLNSNYGVLFGNDLYGYLASQTQSAVIGLGYEIERLINGAIPEDILTPHNEFGKIGDLNKSIVTQPEKPKAGERKGVRSDYGIFYHDKRKFLIIEMKMGYDFDTQKSRSIKSELQRLTDHIAGLTNYSGAYYICSFMAVDVDQIKKGFNGDFSPEQIMTGLELCAHLETDYEDILSKLNLDQQVNREYITEMVKFLHENPTDEIGFLERIEVQKTGQQRLF